MGLRKCGVIFPVKTRGKKIVASGHLAITTEMLEEWMGYDEEDDRGTKVRKVEIGIFSNTKDGKTWSNVCEFLPGSEEEKGKDDGEPEPDESKLPF